jgi:signal transduction histidine kinase
VNANSGSTRSIGRFLGGWRLLVLAVSVTTVMGLLSFAYHYLDVFARARSEPYHEKLIEELTSNYGIILIFPIIAAISRRLRGVPWPAALAAHAGAAAVLSFLATSWRWGSRVTVFRLFGLGEYDYGIMSFRYLMELPNDVVWYAIFAGLVLLVDHYRRAQQRELQLARVEAELSRVRLEALEARLHPHFLFNALHTISSVMYEDVRKADTMLARLSDLLRRTLRIEANEVALSEELDLASLWTDVMRARFGDRLEVEVEASPEARRGMVPPLVLQPLLENALKHGDPGPGRRARVAVRAFRTHTNGHEGELVLEVRDNGPGLSIPAETALVRGIGLSTTQRRLEAMYAGTSRLGLQNLEGGGLAVTVAIPFHTRGDD